MTNVWGHQHVFVLMASNGIKPALHRHKSDKSQDCHLMIGFRQALPVPNLRAKIARDFSD